MQRNIFAYTAPGGNFPEYISINDHDGRIEVSVRSPVETNGATACMNLPRDQAIAMYQALLRHLLPTDKA